MLTWARTCASSDWLTFVRKHTEKLFTQSLSIFRYLVPVWLSPRLWRSTDHVTPANSNLSKPKPVRASGFFDFCFTHWNGRKKTGRDALEGLTWKLDRWPLRSDFCIGSCELTRSSPPFCPSFKEVCARAAYWSHGNVGTNFKLRFISSQPFWANHYCRLKSDVNWQYQLTQ